MRDALLACKYALDEPCESQTEMWAENDQILGYCFDYLAGQLSPNEKFTNDGRTGAKHRNKAPELVLHWIDYRPHRPCRMGFDSRGNDCGGESASSLQFSGERRG